MTVPPVNGFHRLSQIVTRNNPSINEAERSISDHRNNLTSFMMNGKLTARGAELAAKKAASNRGKGRGSVPSHPPNKVGFSKSRLMGRLSGREAAEEDKDTMGDMEYRKRKGGSTKARKVFHIPPW